VTQCKDIRAGLDDWLDHLADARIRAEIDAHLAECDACTRLFKRHQKINRDLTALSQAADRMADTVKSKAATSRAPWWRPLLRVAAAILIVAGAGLFVVRPWQPEAPVQIADNGDALPPDHQPPSPPAFRITVPDDRMAVPVESANPRIHIVWLYQEVLPPDEAAGDDADDSSSTPSKNKETVRCYESC